MGNSDRFAEFAVEHKQDQRRFEIVIDDERSLLTYSQADGKLVLLHTMVPEGLRGRGLATRLAKAALDYARSQGMKVEPRCPFVAAFLEQHPEYAERIVSK